SRRRHTRWPRDWSSDVCSSDLSMADWTLRPRLLSIPGLSQITVIGGETKQYQVLLDPQKMLYHNVTFEEVRTALENANVNSTGEIGRASCRERVESAGGAGGIK